MKFLLVVQNLLCLGLAGCASVAPSDSGLRAPANISTLWESSFLWDQVHTKCVPEMIQRQDPHPCVAVDVSHGEDQGYAVWKDQKGASHFLIIPTKRITGIEDPILQIPATPNYFAIAWSHANLVGQASRKNLVRTQIALNVNSVFARTQDQLHIHLDCVAPEVSAQLNHISGWVTEHWGSAMIVIEGIPFRVRRLESESLNQVDPFKMLAQDLGGHADEIGHHALGVVGAVFSDGKPGFYILDGYKSGIYLGRTASGDVLLDKSCAIAR